MWQYVRHSTKQRDCQRLGIHSSQITTTADNRQTVTTLGFHDKLWRLFPHVRRWGRLLPSATSQADGEHSPVSPPSSSAMSLQQAAHLSSGLCSCKHTRQDWPISVPLVSLLKARSRQTSLCNAVYQRKCFSERVYNFVLNIKTEINTPVGLLILSDTVWDAKRMHSW